MKPHTSLAAAAAAAVMLACSQPVLAADDHGHDHDAPAPAVGPAAPRFSAASQTFEMVGVLDGKELTLYVDRFADNSPAEDAGVQLEIDGRPVALTRHAPAEYHASLPSEPAPGTTAVVATIAAGGLSERLAGDLVIERHAEAVVDRAAPWRRQAVWGAAAVLAVALLWWGGRRRHARSLRTGAPS